MKKKIIRSVVYHLDHIAYYYAGELKTGTIIEAGKATYPNGRRPAAGERVICGTCGHAMRGTDVHIEYEKG